jgi:hypothetical protein
VATLGAVDDCNQKIVATVCATVPLKSWRAAQMVVRCSPTGVGRYEYTYWEEDGTMRQDLGPRSPGSAELWRMVLAQRVATEAVGQPLWFKMVVNVQRDGKFTTEFEYRDHYVEGDIFRDGP